MSLQGNVKRQKYTYWSWGEGVRSACEDSTTINKKPTSYCRCLRTFWAGTKMHTFRKGKLPTCTAAELVELRLVFLRESTEKVAATLKLFYKNHYHCNYGREGRWQFGPGSVRTEPFSTDQRLGTDSCFSLSQGQNWLHRAGYCHRCPRDQEGCW